MEGYNPNAFCTLTACNPCSRRWVPSPPHVFPRRHPLVDAIALTEDPCHPPGRCPPCCKPVPKFRMLREFDACNLKNFKQEQEKQKRKDCYEQWNNYYQSLLPHPSVEVGFINPERQVLFETDPPYVGRYKEMRRKTDIIAGFFNPDDNKTDSQRYAERCDPACVSCSPHVPEYPCRGVIGFPLLRWVSKEEEERTCFPGDCKKGPCSYLTPEYLYELKKKREMWAQEDRDKVCQEIEEKQRIHDQYLGSYACPCAAGRCSETIGCYHPTKLTS